MTFADPGDYTVTLDVDDGYGGSDSDTVWILIEESPPANTDPVADAGPDQMLAYTAGGTTVTLDGSGSEDDDGDQLAYTWTGGFDGGTANGVLPTVTFADPGDYTVTPEVDDGNGGTDTDTVQILIEEPAAPQVINSLLALAGRPSVSCNPAAAPDAPAGVFTITATYQNAS